MSRVRSSAANSRATDQPSSSGIITSSSTRSGRSLRAHSSPARPSAASSTSMPAAARLTRQRSLIERSSSTTSTRRAVPAAGFAWPRPADDGPLPSSPWAAQRQRRRPPTDTPLRRSGVERIGWATSALTRESKSYGQRASFEADLELPGEDEPLRGVFIRAPRVAEAGPGVEVLAELDGEPVLLREGRVLVASFHPELTDDTRVHERFLDLVREEANVRA